MPGDDQAHGMGILGYLVLLLLAFLIILLFFGNVFDIMKSRADPKICRESVEMNAAAHVKGIDAADSIKCPPTMDKIDNGDPHVIMNKTALLMAECFWKFGANEFELFGGDGTYCALCSHIEFKGDAKGQKIRDFRKFLTDEYIPEKYGGDKTFAQYIVGMPTSPDEVKEISMSDNIEIDTDNDYGIMFVYSKNRHIQKTWAALGGGVGTGVLTTIAGILFILPEPTISKLGAVMLVSVGSGIAGADAGYNLGSEKPADWQSAVMLIPYDEENLKKLDCTELPVAQGNK